MGVVVVCRGAVVVVSDVAELLLELLRLDESLELLLLDDELEELLLDELELLLDDELEELLLELLRLLLLELLEQSAHVYSDILTTFTLLLLYPVAFTYALIEPCDMFTKLPLTSSQNIFSSNH
jgi:uncharacterized protein YaaW (UPF0174 family)